MQREDDYLNFIVYRIKSNKINYKLNKENISNIVVF